MHRVITLDQAAGEAMLRSLAETRAPEEMWAYLPDHDRWEDITLAHDATHVTPDIDLHTRQIEEQERILVYHQHSAGHPTLPSANDLINMIQGSRLFFPRHPHGTYAHRVVSVEGILDYRLSSLGVQWFLEMRPDIEEYAARTRERMALPGFYDQFTRLKRIA